MLTLEVAVRCCSKVLLFYSFFLPPPSFPPPLNLSLKKTSNEAASLLFVPTSVSVRDSLAGPHMLSCRHVVQCRTSSLEGAPQKSSESEREKRRLVLLRGLSLHYGRGSGSNGRQLKLNLTWLVGRGCPPRW